MEEEKRRGDGRGGEEGEGEEGEREGQPPQTIIQQVACGQTVVVVITNTNEACITNNINNINNI